MTVKPILNALTASVLAGLASGQAAKQTRLLHLSAAQVDAIVKKIPDQDIPDNEPGPGSDNNQDFLLRSAGEEDFALLPGVLQVEQTGKSLQSNAICGIFVVHTSGRAQYVSVIGPDYKPISDCQQLDALGLSADPGPRPRLVAIFFIRALGNNHYDMPFVLTWDAGTSTYKVDYPTSFWLAKQPHGDTVPGARKLLAARK